MENSDNKLPTTTTTTTTTSTTNSTVVNTATATVETDTVDTTNGNIVGGKRKRLDEEVITIQDALNDQLEEEKNLLDEAKLQEQEDWGDENICTFDKGYINQSVFACKTCQQTNDKVFGFCYGCSMQCHLMHDVYELFNKKDFRCDCGTKVQQCQSNGFKCILQGVATPATSATGTGTTDTTPIGMILSGEEKKEILNDKNHYNHNFKGLYCYCDSVYDYKEDMIQCIFCMDWFHEQCLKLNSKVSDIPSTDEFQDLVCSECLKSNQFLLSYQQIRLYIVGDNIIVDDPIANPNVTTTDSVICKIKDIPISSNTNDLFCKESWRDELCLCADCKQLYKDKNVEFLFEKEEPKNKTIDETAAAAGSASSIDILKMGQDVFDKTLPPVQQRVLIEGFSDMKDKLRELFTKKLDTNQVVTKQDIQSFFTDLNKKFKK